MNVTDIMVHLKFSHLVSVDKANCEFCFQNFSSIFTFRPSVRPSSVDKRDIQHFLHNMMFQTIQTIYFLKALGPRISKLILPSVSYKNTQIQIHIQMLNGFLNILVCICDFIVVYWCLNVSTFQFVSLFVFMYLFAYIFVFGSHAGINRFGMLLR